MGVLKMQKGISADVHTFEFVGLDGYEWTLIVGDTVAVMGMGNVMLPLPCFTLRADSMSEDGREMTMLICVPNKNTATELALMFETWAENLRKWKEGTSHE